MFLYRMMVTPHAPKSFKDRTLSNRGVNVKDFLSISLFSIT